MIVLDASAVVELLVDDSRFRSRLTTALASDADWVMPAHGATEAANALRGLWLGGRSTDAKFDGQLAALARIEVETFSIVPLLPRIRELASNATAYDAAYIALAEHLDAPVLSVDTKLARIPGSRAEVRVITADA